MDSKLKLAVRIAIVVMCVIVAFCMASAVGNIIAGKVIQMTPYETTAIDTSGNSPQEKKVEADDSDILIYNRNLFNQKAGSEEQEETAKEPEPEVDPPTVIEEISTDGNRPVLTDLKVLLKGTQVASDPRYSVAMFMPLEGGNDARMAYLSEGDNLMDEAKIIKIVRNRVYMTRTTQNDRLEYLDTRTTEQDLEEARKVLEKQAEKEKQIQAEREKAAAAATAAAEKKPGETTEVVKKLGNDTYEVSRDVVEQIRKNPNSLKNNAEFGALPKVQPVYSGGNIGGFRLLGVDESSIYAQLGLKSGDTIIDVNGQQIDGPQKAMSLFDALKPGQDVALKINRRGQEKTLTFQLK